MLFWLILGFYFGYSVGAYHQHKTDLKHIEALQKYHAAALARVAAYLKMRGNN